MDNESINTTSSSDFAGNGDDEPQNKKKALPFLIAAAVALIALLVGIGIYNSPINRIHRQLELGYKYLEEENYEQAIIEFDKAIAIDPMNEETINALTDVYLAYAQSVMDVGDLETAVSILLEGYEKTRREELHEKVQELQEIIAQEKELRLKKEEEAKAEEIRQLFMEKRSEIFQLGCRCNEYMYGECHISDAQIKESCRQYADILEAYRGYFPEADYSDWSDLWYFYYVLNEFELCLETRRQLYELSGDEYYLPESHTIHFEEQNDHSDEFYDEYGRLILVTGEDYIESANKFSAYEGKREYGENGKLIQYKFQSTYHLDTGAVSDTLTTHGYDSSGRLSQKIRNEQVTGNGANNLESISIYTYIYNENGFTLQLRAQTDYSGGRSRHLYEYDQDYELNEYGEVIEIGEKYNVVDSYSN